MPEDAQPMEFVSAYNDHYEEAHRRVKTYGNQCVVNNPQIAAAQVYATLALAEATMEMVELMKTRMPQFFTGETVELYGDIDDRS